MDRGACRAVSAHVKKYASLGHNKIRQVFWNRQIINLMPTLPVDGQSPGFPASTWNTIEALVKSMRPHIGARQNVAWHGLCSFEGAFYAASSA